MGDRYILKIICPKCKTEDPEVYFAPTCGHKIDLCKHTGISYEDASNAGIIEDLMSF